MKLLVNLELSLFRTFDHVFDLCRFFVHDVCVLAYACHRSIPSYPSRTVCDCYHFLEYYPLGAPCVSFVTAYDIVLHCSCCVNFNPTG